MFVFQLMRSSGASSSKTIQTENGISRENVPHDNNNQGQVTLETSQSDNISQLSPSMKRFKLLAVKLVSQHQASRPVAIDETLHNQLNQYISELQHSFLESTGNTKDFNALGYWESRHTQYRKLAEFAVDVLSAPASQAYVERIFSVCGLLTAGHRNRMHKSLAMRVCLQLNKNIFHELGCL